jgi:hypothetical protein
LSWEELTKGPDVGTWLPEVVGPSFVEVHELTFNRLLLAVLVCKEKKQREGKSYISKVSQLHEQTGE